MDFPIRINKYLSEKGLSTRRGADELIARGKVLVNGKRATIGQKIEASDNIEVHNTQTFHYLAYYKPKDVATIASTKTERAIKDVAHFVDENKKPLTLIPIGRLDKESEGLILMTNDHRLSNRLLNPKYYHEKEYEVRLNKPITNTLLRNLKSGVDIAGGHTRPAKVKKIDPQTLHIILTEGKNRQIRRMCEALGFTVTYLKRFRIINILIGNLKPNTYRFLSSSEEKILREMLKLPK